MSPLILNALRWLTCGIVRLFYRIEVLPSPRLPEGGCIVLPNHLSWVDAVLLQVATPRPIRFIVDETIYQNRKIRPLLHLARAIPISAKRAKDGIRTAVNAIKKGEVVCIFPEGEISRAGSLLRIQKGFELIARESDAQVVPVWLDEVWGSLFSFSQGRYFLKWPKRFPYTVRIAYGLPMSSEEACSGSVRESLLDLGELCFQQRPALRGHLGRAAIEGLMRLPFSEALVDGMDGSSISRADLLAAGLALSVELRRKVAEPRVAIVLPPGKGATIVNLAVVLSGKIPVNLNFTASRPSIEAALRIAGLKSVVTAASVKDRFPEFAWPEQVHFVEQIMPSLKTRVILWRCSIGILPSSWIAALAKVPVSGDRAEAVTLFTSGSSGEPKGVVLSHRNLLGNVGQFSHALELKKGDSILACLPLFHSFGSTVNLWYPLIEGMRMVTFPSPLDAQKNSELIERHSVKLLCSTPTFLRGYLRKVEPRQLRSLELVVTGAEKLPLDLAHAFQKRFGKTVLQGYGLTETSPVASVNLPDPPAPWPGAPVQTSNRSGAVGRLMPGMTARIRDPETGHKLSLHETGMLWLKGPNIFEMYLNDPLRTGEALQDGWLKTGDLGRFDADGFLFIEGRLSRFSKIAGEMVPHETLEASICKVLGVAEGDRPIAITGVPDEAKGEALILLSTIDVELPSLRTQLSVDGVPNLWIPRRVVRVSEIPHLPTGKLDLRRMQAIAAAACAEHS